MVPISNFERHFIDTRLQSKAILQTKGVTEEQKHVRKKNHVKLTDAQNPLKQAIHHTEHSNEHNLEREGKGHTCNGREER